MPAASAARLKSRSAGWRAALRIVGMALALFACLPGHYACRLFRLRSPWPRIFLGLVGRIAGLRVSPIGKPLSSHVLFLANHVSWLDIMLMAGTTGCSFVSKQEVAQWPVAGWLARLNRTIFVARTERGAVRDQADVLRVALASGIPVTLYPEGTTEGGIAVLPFRASLLAALFPPLPGIKVQPVAIDYHAVAHDIAWIGDESAKANVLRILGRRGTIPVTVRFLDPVNPGQMAGRKELAAAARDDIVASLRSSPATADRL